MSVGGASREGEEEKEEEIEGGRQREMETDK